MTSVMLKLIALLISLLMIISGCGNGDTVYDDSSAEVSTESSTESSEESAESSDESLDESSELVEDSSADESIEKNESIDVSEDSAEASTEVSEPEPDISEDVSSIEPTVEDVSKPDEDISEPVEDVSKPDEDISKPTECVHEYTVSQKKAPTCAEDGVEETYCKHCKLVKTSTGIQRLGHSWGEWAVTKEATSTNEGSKQRTCFRCGKCEIEIIPKVEEADISFTKADADYIANEFLRILNEKRAELGRQPLVTAPIAHQMATERSVQISEHFSHTLPDGRDGARAICKLYQYNIANEDNCLPFISGENIGSCYVSVDSIVRWGMESELKSVARQLITSAEASYGHWYDLTNERYTACGVGVCIAIDDEYGEYFAYICIMTMDKLYGTDAA